MEKDLYRERGEAAAERQRKITATGRDISHRCSWKPADPERRAKCRDNLEIALLTYFPAAFTCAFSPAHKKMIRRLQIAQREGGTYCCAMPRGDGKTAVMIRALILAVLYGFSRFAIVVSATDKLARKNFDDIRGELTENGLLAADFPEVCEPFRELDNKSVRARGQRWGDDVDGFATLVRWEPATLITADIPVSTVGGSVIMSVPILSAKKGLHHTQRSGRIIRPDFLLIDDPQTNDSARSKLETEDRQQIIDGELLGLFGRDAVCTAVMAVTPIYPDDLAIRFLDREKKPEWQGESTPMILAWPDDAAMAKWDQWRQIGDAALRNDGDRDAHHAYYRANRDDMDRGAAVAWPERIQLGFVSALEHAMHLRFTRATFWAEYQMEVSNPETSGLILSPAEMAKRVNGLPGGLIPDAARWLTGFVDVHHGLLYKTVIAWAPDFTGWLVAYDTWPRQHRRHFSQRDPSPSLTEYLHKKRSELVGSPIQTLVGAALDACLQEMLSAAWTRVDGGTMSLDRILVDSGDETESVYAAVGRLKQRPGPSAVVMSSKGIPIGPGKKRFADYTVKPGDLHGPLYHSNKPPPGKPHLILIDVYAAEKQFHGQISAALGQAGNFTLYGDGNADHQLVIEHLTSHAVDTQISLKAEAKGQDPYTVFKRLPGREDHYLDDVIGCLSGASMLGACLQGAGAPEVVKRKLGSWAAYG